MIYLNDMVLKVYLDYVNNFLTIPKFAEHYGISEEFALSVIAEGKRLNEWEESKK